MIPLIIARNTFREATRDRILGNRIYQQLSTAVAGTTEYMAIERLYELHEEGSYDLIVLDTPPTRNALDLLEAPNRMADFFGGRMIRIFTAPYRVGGGLGARAINLATRPFYRIADQKKREFDEDIRDIWGGKPILKLEQIKRDVANDVAGSNGGSGAVAAQSRR